MASLGKWTGGAVSILPGTTWAAPANLFPTEDRNDGYTWAAATSTLTLPSSDLADGYLIVGAFEFEDTSNGRHNPQARITQASGTGTFAGSPTSGYNRDNSEDRSYCRTWGFVDNPSASATFQFQWRRDTDAPTGGTVRSEIQVIPLYYADAGIYTSASTACPGGTTVSQVTGFSGTDGTNITLASNTVSVTGDNKRYLCLGGYYWQGIGAARTQRWGGFRIDGTFDDSAKGYSYGRNAANADIGEFFTQLIETATATRTVDIGVYRGDGVAALQGGANSDGNVTGSNPSHALVVLELNDSAELFYTKTSGNSFNLAQTGPVNVDMSPASEFNGDSASFTRSGNGAVNAEVAMDALVGANVSAASNVVSTGQRWTGFSEFTLNGTEQSDSFAGDYLRNNQGSQDTFGWSANLLGFLDVSLNFDIGVSVTELPGSEGGGGGVISPAGWVGVWGLNLDTLQASGGSDASGSGSVAGAGTTTATGQKGAQGTTSVTGAGAITALAVMTALGTASVSDTGATTAQGQKQALAAASVSGAGITAAQGQKQAQISVTVSGTGSTAASGSASTTSGGVASVTGSGAITGQGDKSAFIATQVSGTGAVSATGTKDFAGTVQVTASGVTTASGAKTALVSLTISESGSVTASGIADSQGGGSAVVSGAGLVTSDGQKSTTGTASVSAGGNVALQASKAALSAVSVTGSGSTQASGEVSLEVSGSAQVSGTGTVSGQGIKAAEFTVAISGVAQSASQGASMRFGQVALSGQTQVTASGIPGTVVSVVEKLTADGRYETTLTGDGLL